MAMVREKANVRAEIVASMKETGMLQRELARRIGIHEVTLSHKMSGKPFTEDELLAIKRVFRWKTLEGRER